MKTRRSISISILFILVMGALSCAIIGSRQVSLDEQLKAADWKIELAEHVQACKEHVRLENTILPKAGKLYKRALKVYLKIIKGQPDEKYAQLAHSRAAEIYQKRSEWDDVTAHYRAIVDIDPNSYLGDRAQKALDEIRPQQQRIGEKLVTIETSKNGAEVPQALFEVAQAYEKIGGYSEAIRFYERLVSEFPDHQLAPKAQYQVAETLHG